MKLRTIAATVAVAGALALTACGQSVSPQNIVTHHTATPTQAAVVATPTPTPAPVAAKQATWGDTVTLPSGLAFTLNYVGIKPATTYTNGGQYSGQTTVFSVTVKNGTTQNVDGGQFVLAQPLVTYGTDGVRAPGNGWDGYTWPSMGTLLPGESQTSQVGYDVPAAGFGDVRVEFDVPMYLGNAPVIFKGAVK